MQRVVSQNLKRTLALATVAAAALLAGCGGGSTQQIDPFSPTRVIAFGDESAAILQSGKFLRDHVAYTSYRALFVKTKRGSRLCDDLVAAGVFSQSQLDAVQKKGL